LLYLSPALVILSIFVFYPIVLNIYYSLFEWNSFSINKTFVGLKYYTKLFTDPDFYISIKNNILYAIISLIFQVGGGLVLAALLEDRFMKKFQPFFRTVLFMPSILSLAVVGLLWQVLYQPDIGMVNGIIRALGFSDFSFAWLSNEHTAIYAVIAVSQWQFTGYITMLLLVAMHKVPAELYEAAHLDGASRFHTFFHITIPQIKEMLLVAVTITVVGAFKVFEEVYVMTSGGPGNSSDVMGTMLYRSGFRNDEMGYAATIATIIFIITLLLSLLQIKATKTGKE
jgi:raffinose/stachyose/melibiose transport system permease protein